MLDLILLDISKGWKTAIMIVAMIVVFYVFLIRPQTQKQKEEEKYRKSLEKGSHVMTSGGIHATIVSINDNYALIEIAKDTRIKVQLASLNPIPETTKSKK